MNPLVLTFLLCFVCGDLGAQGSETTLSSDINGVTGGPESGEVLQGSQGDEDDVLEEKHSGEASDKISHEFHLSKDAKRNRRGKGKKKNKHKSKSTTAFSPEHTMFTDGYTSTLSTTEDPCTSTHLGYCIHGYCKHMEGLQEPVCICMKGYDGERCGIQTLETIKTNTEESSDTELVQTVLVIVAVVLSAISCTAILLMTCAQSHKNFLASYLGTWAEQEKLQKPLGDPVV